MLTNHKNILSLAVTLWLSGVGSQAGQANVTQAARQALQSAYRGMDAAAARRDVDKVLSYDSPDYKVILPGGPQGLAQQRHVTQLMLGTAQKASSSTAIKQISLSGRTAVVICKRHYDIVTAFVDPDTGKRDHFVIDTLNRDTWAQAGQRWLRTSSQVLSKTASRNGQKEPHRA